VRAIALTGVLTAGVSLVVYLFALRVESLEMARAHAFSVLVFAELLRSFGARSETRTVWEIGVRSNVKLAVVVALSIAIQLGSHRVQVLESFLESPPMPWSHTAALLAMGFVPLLVLEIVKVVKRRNR